VAERTPGILHFADQGHARVGEYLRQRPSGIEPRTGHHQVKFQGGAGFPGSRQAEDHTETFTLQILDSLLQFDRIAFIKHHRNRPLLAGQTSRPETTATGTEDGYVLWSGGHERKWD
jgi:hypothetical protein